MSTKVLIPALRAKVGDWQYYICVMKYAQVAQQINFAFELGGNQDLNSLIQRGISSRTKEIVSYLQRSPNRFLGALLVAVYGGDPEYLSVEMHNVDGLLTGLDNSFGVLTFDGSQQYFALDGQHRLHAIKEAIKKNPELGSEDIAVILVSHYDTPGGREKTRRLFTNINRNAVSTSQGENIALDEDDGFAIITRRLINEHPFLKEDGRVIVFTKHDEDGTLKISGGNVPTSNKKAFTTITTLYKLIKDISHDLHDSMKLQQYRPTDDVLEESYILLSERMDDLFLNCGNIKIKIESKVDAREIRNPKGKEEQGHPFMRGVIQSAVTRSISQAISQGVTWETLMIRLNSLDWKLSSPPWCSVIQLYDDGGKKKMRMLTQRDFISLLDDLLLVHLAPSSKAEITRAIKKFKTLKPTEKYPVSEEKLAENIITEVTGQIKI